MSDAEEGPKRNLQFFDRRGMQTLTDTSCPMMPVIYHGWMEARSDVTDWVYMKTAAWGECLFIDGQLQSCQRDEHIYHEMLVHPLFLGLSEPKRVLVLGGGEGCTAREVLRWKSVEAVTQIDWDQPLCEFFRRKEDWNQGAYKDPRLTVIHEDVTSWLPGCQETFDAIIVDLCDPSDDLPWFLQILESALRRLSPSGGLIVNAGETRIETETPACAIATWLKEACPQKTHLAIKQYVPSFLGEWCFLAVAPRTWSHQKEQTQIPEGLKHLTRHELIHSLTWNASYPETLRTFWHVPTPSPQQSPPQKLEEGFKPDPVIDWETHYGC